MKKLIRTSMVFALTAALPASGVAAEQPVQSSVVLGEASAAQAEHGADPSVEAQWAAAEEALRSGDLRGSLKRFSEIAKIQRENALNASQAYWRIAEIQNALGKPLQTAQALDNAAREADRFGDVDMQVRAMYEAAVAYSAGSRINTSAQRLRRVQGLLGSGRVSPEVRDQITVRMNG